VGWGIRGGIGGGGGGGKGRRRGGGGGGVGGGGDPTRLFSFKRTLTGSVSLNGSTTVKLVQGPGRG